MRYFLIAILAVLASLAADAPKSPCDYFTRQDAQAVLGQNVARQDRQGMCIWGVPGKPLVLVVILDSNPDVAKQIQLPRQNVPRNGGTVVDEPSVAPGAYSARMGGAQAIYFVKGKTGVSVSVTNDNRGILPIMLDKLRPLAKKIASQL